jgi:pyridoxamine 5'-phosphate oxidase
VDERDLDPDPMRQFQAWFDEARAAGVSFPDTMTLATATPDGRPSARMVLLKSADERGFAFFTNRESRKAGELALNPWAALVVYWQPLGRQVRVEGSVEPIGDEESSDYWRTRPLGSRLSAWASPQSRPVESRAWLEERVAEVAGRYPDEPPLPPHWGGYRLRPESVEFWLHRDDRLHDRVLYRRSGDGWTTERLAP